jgi:hypothetical protein
VTARRSKASKKTTRRAKPPLAVARKALKQMQSELPATLDQFSKRVRMGLTRLERTVEKAEVRYRRQAARMLRDASHRLGRFEAEGERRWKKLTSEARREALSLLRRMERTLEAQQPRKRRLVSRRKVASARVTNGRDMAALI